MIYSSGHFAQLRKTLYETLVEGIKWYYVENFVKKFQVVPLFLKEISFIGHVFLALMVICSLEQYHCANLKEKIRRNICLINEPQHEISNNMTF